MKRILWMVLLLTTSYLLCYAQFEKGQVELSLIGNAGYQKETTSSHSNSESVGHVLINACVGYYIVDGLSLEPQIGLLAIENVKPSQSVLLNLSYTGRIANSNIALFLRGGYGISNSISIPMFAYTPIRIQDKWDVHILNVGAGVKFLIKECATLRFELNYRTETYPYELHHYYYSGSYSYDYTESVDYTFSSLGLLFGISIIL